jgi:hypothetical protein
MLHLTKTPHVVCCTLDTPVRDVSRSLQAGATTVLLLKDSKVQGVIRDCRRLIDEHAYPASPVSIGHLLTNAVRASFLVTENDGFSRRLERSKQCWVSLTASTREVIAWLSVSEAFPQRLAA